MDIGVFSSRAQGPTALSSRCFLPGLDGYAELLA